MRRARFLRTLPALGLGLALSSWLSPSPDAFAQGPGVSSGSGSGTGTGMSSGFPGSTGTGNESSSGLGTTGTGREGLPGSIGRPGLLTRPGDLTRPIDRRAVGGRDGGDPGSLSYVEPQLFLDARSVVDPGERALALVRIAQTAIFSKQLQDAHNALFEAGPAALSEPDPLVREQRISAIVDTLLSLAEERMSDTSDAADPAADPTSAIMPPPAPAPSPGQTTPPPGQTTPPPTTSASPGLPPAPKPNVDGRTPAAALPEDERRNRLNAALPEWAQAVDLAMRIELPTPRTEALFRIIESEAFSSQRLITDPLRLTGGRPDPASLPPDLRSYTDGLLASAARHASMIDRPIWRNYATYSIVSNAAASSQFARGFQIARGVSQPEARTNALIRLAEGQALNSRPSEATATYAEAARAVSLIPQDDPRETLVGVLIDSLISFGRFDDARACIPLYRIPARQLVALSAIAESQGRRGLAESARIWIGREAPVAYRPVLYRKVNDGLLASIEQNRSKDLSAKGQ